MFRGGPGHGHAMERAKVKDIRGTLKRLWGYLRVQQGALIASGLLVMVGSAISLAGPYIMSIAIDRYLMRRQVDGLTRLCAILVVLYLVSSLSNWLQSVIIARAALRTVRDIRKDLFGSLQRLPLRFFDSRQHGDLMSRLTNDVETVSQVLADSVTTVVSSAIAVVGSLVMMLIVNPVMAVVTLSAMVTMSLGTTRWLSRRIRDGFRDQQAWLGKLNGLIEETIDGQRVVKAYSREPVVLEEFSKLNAELRTAATRAQTMAGFGGPLMNGVGNTSLAIIAGLGGWLAVNGHASVGTIAAFISYARAFGWPLNMLAGLYNVIQGAIAGAERVFEVMDETPEVDAAADTPPAEIRGDVEFRDVTFGYNPETPVLCDINLHAAAGDTIALVGPTGAGKTTIVNLLTRFYEVDHGEILVDGRNITGMRKSDLRRQLGIVLQDTFLFAGSIADNIRYGRLDATDDEIVSAAKLANAHAFIHRLPHGYSTQLSERGGNLSQGQRQLVSIARAVLADPRILILDEATSSVDTRTEQHIQEAMLRLMTGRTSFVIAHRLSTIRGADQILVIDGGRIIERGNHAELMAAQGFYHGMVTGGKGPDALPAEDAATAPA